MSDGLSWASQLSTNLRSSRGPPHSIHLFVTATCMAIFGFHPKKRWEGYLSLSVKAFNEKCRLFIGSGGNLIARSIPKLAKYIGFG